MEMAELEKLLEKDEEQIIKWEKYTLKIQERKKQIPIFIDNGLT